ncbi:MAG: hypothetical protein FJX59_05410 [Alphaproteobacteria bacterium]|nr:hypothetical protein [Alphaproteobacteria bacterium]
MARAGIERAIKRGVALGLTRREAGILARLRTPAEVQDFVDRIPMNFEPGGDTVLSVRQVLKQRRAHCIEGAFVAACALAMQGRKPLLMDMQAIPLDDDHVITIFKDRGLWGAVSKSNAPTLRYRDPVYRTLRELAMSYFHEYSKDRVKTLKTYSVPIDLSRYDVSKWVTSADSCWDMADWVDKVKHFKMVPGPRRLRLRDKIEAAAGKLEEHRDPRKKK